MILTSLLRQLGLFRPLFRSRLFAQTRLLPLAPLRQSRFQKTIILRRIANGTCFFIRSFFTRKQRVLMRGHFRINFNFLRTAVRNDTEFTNKK